MGIRKAAWRDEEPSHTVRITQPFWLGETPVTQEQFDIWKRAEKVEHEYWIDDQPRNPADSVSWRNAIAYCSWLANTKRKQLPRGFPLVCLPTEAEWEYACRAGTNTVYHTGDGEDDLADAGWFRENREGLTHLVGRKKANSFGLYDMHGNVSEWCQDEWYPEAYQKREDGVRDPGSVKRLNEWRAGLPTMLDPSQPRVVRGGYWFHAPSFCRSARRGWSEPFSSFGLSGFRGCLARGPAAGSREPRTARAEAEP
jgi:formylglycine-generating enzyme required for sulfatase activity